jgi:hypothetical protein
MALLLKATSPPSISTVKGLLEFFRLSHATIDQTARGLSLSLLLGGMGILPETFLTYLGVSNDAMYVMYDIVFQNTIGFMADIMIADEVGFCILAKNNASCMIEAAEDIIAETSASEIAAKAQQMATTLFKSSSKIPTQAGGGGKKLYDQNAFVNMFSALGGMRFLKYIITIFIGLMITLPMYMLWLRYNQNAPVWKRRLVKMSIEATTFLVFGNILRYAWAYRDTSEVDKVHDLIVIVFTVAASVSFLNTPNALKGEEGEVIMNIRAKFIIIFIVFALISIYQLFVEIIQRRKLYIPQNLIAKVLPGIIVLSSILAAVFSLLFSKQAKSTIKDQKKVTTFDWVYSSVAFGLCLIGFVGLVLYVVYST